MIVIYTSPSCSSCRKVKQWFDEQKIDYVEKNIFVATLKEAELKDILMKSELLRFFWILIENKDIKTKDFQAEKNGFLKPVIEYMNENFSENITVSDLAVKACMSKSYFMQRFKDSAGMGAIEYLSQLRIKKACEILKDSDMSSCDTAFMCGFRNLSNFNRQFRKIVGMTPKEYRIKNR